MLLPETTTDRLLAVADIIDLSPERWDQTVWYEIDQVEWEPASVTGRGMTCDSVACIAGWGVALTPRSCQSAFWRTWDIAGSHALGLRRELSFPLFRSELPMSAGDVADVLRRLAKLPDRERDLLGAKDVLTDDQYERLTRED